MVLLKILFNPQDLSLLNKKSQTSFFSKQTFICFYLLIYDDFVSLYTFINNNKYWGT